MSERQRRRLIIVSGLSGAGKTVVLHALEDHGFYCVDNLPLAFLARFIIALEFEQTVASDQIAVGIDARNQSGDIAELPSLLATSNDYSIDIELVFVTASDETLIKRFSETRRRHPLTGARTTLPQAIVAERVLLEPLLERADLVVDTSSMHLHQLRAMVRERVVGREVGSLSLQVMSFGFKHGVPPDADFVFDVRCLPNPHWDATLRDLPGTSAPVAEFLEASERVPDMVEDITRFCADWIGDFDQSDRAYLTVAIGCTGGRHRSVYVAERVAARFSAQARAVILSHRDLR
jgi:UPF0042 nucleotide-binding protein